MIEYTTRLNQNLAEPKVLKRSQRARRYSILDDYIIYLQEFDFDIGVKEDLATSSQAIKSDDLNELINAM